MVLEILPATAVALSLAGCAQPTTDPTADEATSLECDPRQTFPTFRRSPGGTPELAPDAVRRHACQLRIVDVREPHELDGDLGVIAGADHVPARRVPIAAMSWDPGAPVVFACRSGRRSGAVARELAEAGFSRVASMTGGMLRWNDLGFSTTTAPTTPPQSSTDRATPRRKPLSVDDVAAHVADRERVRWTKAAALMLHGTQACVDGRDAHAIVGTPGGDAGELVLALATAERHSGRAFAAADVDEIFDQYLQAFGHFYLHSDDHAVAALIDRLEGDDARIAAPRASDHAATAAFLRAPPTELQPALRQLIADPAYVGCGHLRLMLQHPQEYGIRRELVANVLRAFFNRLWDGDPALEFVALEGGHAESAVVTIQLPHDVHAYTAIPLVSPRLPESEVFVAHPQVARFVRRENAAFLLERIPLLAGHARDEAAFFHDLEALAERQAGATLAHLASGLPRFKVLFDGDEFQVLQQPDEGEK